MENTDNPIKPVVKLQVQFPSSSEDRRMQLVDINGSIYAILFSPLESEGPINLNCEDWSLVLLAPIKSKMDVVVSAINVLCLNTIESKEGSVFVNASHRLVKLAPAVVTSEKGWEKSTVGEFQLGDDVGAFMNYFKLFNAVISGARSDDDQSIREAQEKFITNLCLLADRIDGKKGDLDLKRVLEIWNIPQAKTI